MADESHGLWPDDLVGESTQEAPFSILKEQAQELARATGFELKGRATRSALPNGGGFTYEFSIVAPSLDYSYDLFRLEQDHLDLYPLDYRFEDQTGTIRNEQELYAWLRKVFSSERTRSVVNRLIKQSNA